MADQEKADPADESAAAADDRHERLASESEPHEGDVASTDGSEPAPATPGEPTETGAANGDSRELVTAGAGRRSRAAGRRAGSSAVSSPEVREDGKAARAKKDRRRSGAPDRTRTGPVTFVRESVGELRKVVYPTGQQLLNYFIVVLVFVLFVIAFVSLLDLAFGAAIFEVFS